MDEPERPADGAGELALLVPPVEALCHGGLLYALDRLRPEAFDRAADAARQLGADDLGQLLDDAAEIARTRRGFARDRAAADFDGRHGAESLREALRETMTARGGPQLSRSPAATRAHAPSCPPASSGSAAGHTPD